MKNQNLSYENNFDLYENERAGDKTRFDSEAKDNSKWLIIKPPYPHYLSFAKIYFLFVISIHIYWSIYAFQFLIWTTTRQLRVSGSFTYKFKMPAGDQSFIQGGSEGMGTIFLFL